MTEPTQSNPLDGKARMIELLQQMRDAARPEGIFERLAVQRLVGAWWHFERFIALAMQRVNTDDAAKHQKNALRWEACYNRAMRELRMLQTARAILNPEQAPPPMANLQQLQHFAKRTAAAPQPQPEPSLSSKSTICETNSHSHEVGRNSPCPCGSGQKYKRCCGVNAPPILNHAA